MGAVRRAIPLGRRPLDVVFVVFFLVNLGLITYIVDLEQLVIADPARFSYPLWPPGPLIDLVHWWGRTFDPVLLANLAGLSMPLLMIARMARAEHPFTTSASD
jgi:hypothetical protein